MAKGLDLLHNKDYRITVLVSNLFTLFKGHANSKQIPNSMSVIIVYDRTLD